MEAMTSTERLNLLRSSSEVVLRKDDMEAYLSLCPPEPGDKYRLSEVLDFLEERGVTYGINESAIIDMIEKEKYNRQILIAKGTEKVDGQDGRFEFLFPTGEKKGPRILPDGSVDYRTLDEITTVSVGQELVYYHKAVAGENGKDVRGKVQNAYRGKELRLLKTKGVSVSEDHMVYLAAIRGKVDYANDKLTVTNVYEINSDVDYLTGDITFEGDLIIHGNVVSGMSLNAAGSITVKGHVEGAKIEAGRDVILENGMQGAGKGKIKAGGNVSGKFFEQVEIICNGTINANSILSCIIKTEGEVIVSGKLGIIVGGFVQAVQGISATIIGNMAEVKTELEAGVPDSVLAEITGCDKKVLELSQKLEQLNIAVNKIVAAESSGRGISPDLAEQKIKLMRAKITLNSEISATNAQKERLSSKMEESINAKIVVTKRIYPGTRVIVNGVSTQIADMHTNITIKRRGPELGLFSND